MLLQTLSRDVFGLFMLATLFGFFYTGVQPIGDALALERLSREGKPFGPARLMGALAFAASALAFGFFLDASGREGWVALTASALMLVALLASFLLGGDKAPRGDVHPLRLLKNRALMRMLAFILPAQATMGYFYAFFPTRFMELPGATGALLGWANLIAALAEIPFLLVGDRLFKRLDAAGVAAISTLALGARWLLVALGQSAALLLLSQLLHGLGYIAISVSMALYIRREVAPEAQASGQALLNVFCYGLARVLGNALGALAARALGRRGAFLPARACVLRRCCCLSRCGKGRFAIPAGICYNKGSGLPFAPQGRDERERSTTASRRTGVYAARAAIAAGGDRTVHEYFRKPCRGRAYDRRRRLGRIAHEAHRAFAAGP